MSRVGKKPINIPAGVKVNLTGNTITVEGPKGKLSRGIPQQMIVEISANQIMVKPPSKNKIYKPFHGLTRTLIANMVEGVVSEFQKVLELKGVGFKAALQGNKLSLQIGYTHPVIFEPSESIKLEVPSLTRIIVKGVDKQLVGETAAKIRSIRKPDSYKGKGLRYEGEIVHQKAGKVVGGATNA